MMRSIFEAIKGAARAIVKQPGTTIAAFALYAALIGAIYLFVTTREATLWELTLTFALMALAILLFFTLQAIGVSYAKREDVSMPRMLGRALADSWKLIIVSLPVAVIAVLIVLGFGAIGSRVTGAAGYLVSGVESILLYLAVPLLAIKLWVAAAREGVTQAFRRLGRHLIEAFALRSLVIYILIAVIFGAVAWVLVFTRMQVGGVWADIWILGARLAAAGVVIFFGWMLTLGSLARVSEEG